MLLRLEIQNFLSFYDKTVFDMFPNPKREHFQNHVYNEKIPLLKMAAIYGENGSGKSNFVKALGFMKSFVEDDDFLKKINLGEYRFQLSEQSNLPISLTIEFCEKGCYYIYEMTINGDIEERFSISGLGETENQLLFERKGVNVVSELIENQEVVERLLSLNRHSSILSHRKYPVFKQNKDIGNLFNWFNDLDVITINSNIPTLIDLLSNYSELFDFANQVMRNIGITNSLTIKETPLDEWIVQQDITGLKDVLESNGIDDNSGVAVLRNNRNEYSVSMRDGEKIVKEFLFEQLGVNGFKKPLKIATQSDGTVRLLTLIPALFDAIRRGKVVVIDELENSIHPNLVYRLVKYYSTSHCSGQLIYTTHLTQLLDQQNLIRPDEVWKTEKENGCTRMSSFNDFKIHSTMNIEKGYIEGRYGGIPSISKIASDEQ